MLADDNSADFAKVTWPIGDVSYNSCQASKNLASEAASTTLAGIHTVNDP